MKNLEKAFQSLTSKEQELLGVDTLFYLATKAENFLKLGPKEYALEDAFGYIDHTHTEYQLKYIKIASQ